MLLAEFQEAAKGPKVDGAFPYIVSAVPLPEDNFKSKTLSLH
jgi:hypothetical protein